MNSSIEAIAIRVGRKLSLVVTLSATLLVATAARAAAPGISGNTLSGSTSTFNLVASTAYLTQPDGQSVYSWGYGCTGGSTPTFLPPTVGPGVGAACGTMQVPGPTLIVTEGQVVKVTLTNRLPAAAGNTSILFPGFTVSTSGGMPGLLTQEAAPGGTVTYQITAQSPGTRAYYSGTQGDLQVEMGLHGAVIVLPKNPPSVCGSLGTVSGLPVTNPGANSKARAAWGEEEFRLASAAFDHPGTCYDREYLFQFSEMDANIHNQALAQVTATRALAVPPATDCNPSDSRCHLNVPTEPYHPNYFMINGRSMPDNMDPNYALQYPNQPYNGNPHMHPGEITLLRIIGQGRWQHTFHEHGNHVRILARDGNLIVGNTAIAYAGAAAKSPALAGPLLFTTSTTPGMAMDGLFYFTGRGLNWDMYGHHPGSSDANATLSCTPDANGYNTLGNAYQQINYFEWCQDHDKPLEVKPFGDLAGGGPATLPDPNIFRIGPWYGGSPYLGPDATTRATFGTCTGSGTSTSCSTTGSAPPSNTPANPPSTEAGYAFMWHSHNEREITTNNIFPGGMLMMMLVDSREFKIDESM